jgi:TRAP-type C4-dicarboxylate transport system substrate-binding protein
MFPSMSVAGIPFMVNDPQALMEALYEVNLNNESAVAQWDDMGIEFMGAWSPGTTIIGSNGPVDGIADLNGLKLRAIGSSLPAAFDAVGANVVSMPAAETYENIERGVADAVSWTLDGPVDYKLMEQLDTWTDPGVGAYTTFALWMNQDFYDGLPADLRAIVDEVRDDFNRGAAIEQFNSVNDEQCTALIDFPNTKRLTAWSADATTEWKDLVQDQLIADYVQQAEADGLADAQGYFDAYVEALEQAGAGARGDDPVSTCITRFEEK